MRVAVRRALVLALAMSCASVAPMAAADGQVTVNIKNIAGEPTLCYVAFTGSGLPASATVRATSSGTDYAHWNWLEAEANSIGRLLARSGIEPNLTGSNWNVSNTIVVTVNGQTSARYVVRNTCTAGA